MYLTTSLVVVLLPSPNRNSVESVILPHQHHMADSISCIYLFSDGSLPVNFFIFSSTPRKRSLDLSNSSCRASTPFATHTGSAILIFNKRSFFSYRRSRHRTGKTKPLGDSIPGRQSSTFICSRFPRNNLPSLASHG